MRAKNLEVVAKVRLGQELQSVLIEPELKALLMATVLIAPEVVRTASHSVALVKFE